MKRSIAEKIYRYLAGRTNGRLPGREEVERNLRLLCAGGDLAEQKDRYYIEKTALILRVMLAGLCLTLLSLALSFGNTTLEEGSFLPRRAAAYELELEAVIDGEEERTVTVSVEPQALSKEESRELLEQVKGQMETYILGENPSLEEVRSSLQLVTQIEGTPVTLSWELDSYEALNLDGSLREENLKEEGSLVELTAILECNGEQEVYRACARVLPPVLSADELLMQELREELAHMQEESSGQGRMELPAQVQGRRISWKEKGSASWALTAALTLLCAGLLYTARDRELKKKVLERDQQMKRDYARIVSKLVLFMGAGSTIRNAWEQVVRDYQSRREKGLEGYRYAFEEMTLTSREIQNGTAEARAYENFGARCRIPCYLKLAALLGQNLTKGNKGLSGLLQMEVQEAFEQRKELARIRSEEASTKLLLPMILMLVEVMLLILVPAGMSMQM